ncbi:hypothetical protein [Agromyces bauzanensis]
MRRSSSTAPVGASGPSDRVDLSNGSEVVALLAYGPVDDEFAQDVAAAREAVEPAEPAWPAD